MFPEYQPFEFAWWSQLYLAGQWFSVWANVDAESGEAEIRYPRIICQEGDHWSAVVQGGPSQTKPTGQNMLVWWNAAAKFSLQNPAVQNWDLITYSDNEFFPTFPDGV